MDLLIQIFLILIFIFLNGFFVMSEFSLVSVRRTRIEELAKRGSKRAQLVLSALNNLSTYISATQFGITLASLALGWIGEPALAHIFALVLEPHLPGHILFISAHAIAVCVSFLLITFLQIIFGELTPKTTALQKSEQLAFLITPPLMAFTYIFKPFIWLLSITAGAILKLFGISQDLKKSAYTEDEIKLILAQSAKSGAIDVHEAEMIERVFRLGDLPISTLMVPKKDVIAFPSTSGIMEVAKDITEENLHVRFPIYEKNFENTIGYVSVMDLYVLSKELKKDIKLKDTNLIRKTFYISEHMRVDDVLLLMKKENIHLGIVINEKKSVVGIVSIEDIIEGLVGEIKQ